MIHYRYTHMETEATTGYFACLPDPALSLVEAFVYLEGHPLDDFMRRDTLHALAKTPLQEIIDTLARLYPNALPETIQVLLREFFVLAPAAEEALASALGNCLAPELTSQISAVTPFIFLRWQQLADRDLHGAWGQIFEANMQKHRALPTPDAAALPPLYTHTDTGWTATHDPVNRLGLGAVFTQPFTLPLAEVARTVPDDGIRLDRPPAEETAALALERLEACGIVQGQEMRHIASLSPIGLLRPWRVSLEVVSGRHAYTLEGQATTYGRGTAVDAARASCLMEMVERASLYVSVRDGHVQDRLTETPVLVGTRREILEKGHLALDPHEYPLEVPYENAPLAWIAGQTATGETQYIPLQMATLFSNLDEVTLFDSLGSTGVATGTTLEEAKLAALTEIIERHAEAVTPFTKESCFTLTSTDPFLSRLFEDYRARGIQVQFQDLTGPLGVPVFKCFVMSRKGTISRGHGAHLDARRAIISALTETPFPYPQGGPSGPQLRNLPQRALEELPNYSRLSAGANLALLEKALLENARVPVYAVLTHRRLQFPVVRAFIPGMELAADRDRFSRIPLALYKNYLDLFNS